jgi:hypothetical protein
MVVPGEAGIVVGAATTLKGILDRSTTPGFEYDLPRHPWTPWRSPDGARTGVLPPFLAASRVLTGTPTKPERTSPP